MKTLLCRYSFVWHSTAPSCVFPFGCSEKNPRTQFGSTFTFTSLTKMPECAGHYTGHIEFPLSGISHRPNLSACSVFIDMKFGKLYFVDISSQGKHRSRARHDFDCSSTVSEAFTDLPFTYIKATTPIFNWIIHHRKSLLSRGLYIHKFSLYRYLKFFKVFFACADNF